MTQLINILEKVQYDFKATNLGRANVEDLPRRLVFYYPCSSIFKCAPYEVHLQPGIYRFELWGSQGGDARYQNTGIMRPDSGGKGAYVRGDLTVTENLTLFLYVGAKGEDQTSRLQGVRSHGRWNGGGIAGIDTNGDDDLESGAGGGGAVDIRLIEYDMNSITNSIEFERSIKSRIMVACSGGGACSSTYWDLPRYSIPIGGPGGDLEAPDLSDRAIGGTQTKGKFGIGSDGMDQGPHNGLFGGSSAGGGAGYRGSLDYNNFNNVDYVESASAGGSSYISGHPECMSPSNIDYNQSSTSNAFHHSGIYFQNTFMIPGNSQMPSPNFNLITGHSGNGVAAITLLTEDQSVPYMKVKETCEDRPYKSIGIERGFYIFLTYEFSS